MFVTAPPLSREAPTPTATAGRTNIIFLLNSWIQRKSFGRLCDKINGHRGKC
jgi:hypothetical protein